MQALGAVFSLHARWTPTMWNSLLVKKFTIMDSEVPSRKPNPRNLLFGTCSAHWNVNYTVQTSLIQLQWYDNSTRGHAHIITLVCSETLTPASERESSEPEDMLSPSSTIIAESRMFKGTALPFRYTSDCVLSQRFGVLGLILFPPIK